jgi:glucuronate isomerase
MYLHDDFLLSTGTARRLFHEVAAGQPIIDYHCHLPAEEVAGDARFGNLADIWLGGDHYKWRAMRAAGVPEEIITGKDADPKERFLAWARTLPQAIRNPLHHWAHLELKRYFDCDLVLSGDTADEIWELANAKLGEPGFTTRGILKKFDVRALGTTDDPADTLEHHLVFAESGETVKMFPTFRPDKAMQTADPEAWKVWTTKLAAAAGKEIGDLSSFVGALEARHGFFHEQGCRLSDHGIDFCPFAPCGERQAGVLFGKLMSGEFLTPEESEQWQTFVLQTVGRWNAARGWTMQFHLGAIRNTNRRMFDKLGPDTGYDAMHDEPVVRKLAAFLDSLAATDELPKCIFYHVNPSALYPLATLMGCFQDGKTAGKMQLGSGWWHVDTLDGMRTQMEALSSVGLLSRFVGMLTDSRSFLSFPRHEYFRRLVCRIIGEDVEAGLIPDDKDLLDATVRGICFENARAYFQFPGV